jgi:sec-independent protein translocase protein TatA
MNLAFFAGPPGLPEILVVLFVFVLLFGAKKLPDLARSMGRSLSEFKKGKAEGASMLKDAVAEPAETATAPEVDKKTDPEADKKTDES